jgi:hypothetical protein
MFYWLLQFKMDAFTKISWIIDRSNREQKPTKACVVLLFKYADNKYNLSYLILTGQKLPDKKKPGQKSPP